MTDNVRDAGCLPEFWGKGATSDGQHATSEQMAAAWSCWESGRGYMQLGNWLRHMGAPCSPYASWNIACRMVQKARKAGLIRLGAGRKWEFVPREDLT